MHVYTYTYAHTRMYVCLYGVPFCCLREWYTEVQFRRVIFEVRVATVSCVESLESLFTTIVLEEREYGGFIQGKGHADFEEWLHCESLDNSQTICLTDSCCLKKQYVYM